ncbi:hypothetical protein [Bacillus sp. mrc49]|uniref:hypothetical protein n=1 Tax=Bacillus sp. mrc49 TaxID=2054913 RepID=UPI000C278D9E|nr:hypothetical protein [Bacillus sp. mrc49]PJN90698.1 hypothetical protein CVN76_09280 [Bacillus sp. mrc49]
MCGIQFILATTYKEAYKEETFVEFEEGIHSYLLKKEKDPANKFGILLNLDIYGETILYRDEIKQLIGICEGLIHTYTKEDKDQQVRRFAKDLKWLCMEAILRKKHVFAIGD